MERSIKIQTEMSEEKYRLVDEYEGVGIYQRVVGGLYVHQEYAFKHHDKLFISYSFMNNDKEDIYDYIDNYNNTGKYGFRAFDKGSYYCIHQNGKLYL